MLNIITTYKLIQILKTYFKVPFPIQIKIKFCADSLYKYFKLIRSVWGGLFHINQVPEFGGGK